MRLSQLLWDNRLYNNNDENYIEHTDVCSCLDFIVLLSNR